MGPAKDGVQPGNNLFSKGQRVVSDKYRKGHEAIKWDKPKDNKDK